MPTQSGSRIGINAWLEEELYQEFVNNSGKLDESWKEVFSGAPPETASEPPPVQAVAAPAASTPAKEKPAPLAGNKPAAYPQTLPAWLRNTQVMGSVVAVPGQAAIDPDQPTPPLPTVPEGDILPAGGEAGGAAGAGAPADAGDASQAPSGEGAGAAPPPRG